MHRRYNFKKLTYEERKARLIERLNALNSAGGADDEDEDDEWSTMMDHGKKYRVLFFSSSPALDRLDPVNSVVLVNFAVCSQSNGKYSIDIVRIICFMVCNFGSGTLGSGRRDMSLHLFISLWFSANQYPIFLLFNTCFSYMHYRSKSWNVSETKMVGM